MENSGINSRNVFWIIYGRRGPRGLFRRRDFLWMTVRPHSALRLDSHAIQQRAGALRWLPVKTPAIARVDSDPHERTTPPRRSALIRRKTANRSILLFSRIKPGAIGMLEPPVRATLRISGDLRQPPLLAPAQHKPGRFRGDRAQASRWVAFAPGVPIVVRQQVGPQSLVNGCAKFGERCHATIVFAHPSKSRIRRPPASLNLPD